MQDDKLIRLLKDHEGLRLFPYKCSADAWTIGYGHNLDAKPLSGTTIQHLHTYGISERGAERLLLSDIDEVLSQLAQVDEWQMLRWPRQAALADMCFNLGFKGCISFVRMWQAIGERNFTKAAHEMLQSKWHRQVGRRAERLAQIMLAGEF
jgi:lysozyme